MTSLRFAAFAVLIALAMLSACSKQPTAPAAETPKTTAAPVKQEPVLYTAQECLRQVQGQANLWSRDARLIHLESDLTPESDGRSGRSAVWRFMYVSGSRGVMRTFICSGSRDANAPTFGLSQGVELPVPRTGATFDSFLLKTDSDKALEITLGHGGESVLKRHPEQPVTYVVEMARGQTAPSWYVIYGKNMKDNKGIGVVNALTGAFLRASK